LLTTLQIGELLVRKSGVEQALVIAGGFLEVSEGTVTVLADFAEHAEEVDVQRAEEARRRAQESLAGRTDIGNEEAARAELRRAVLQLRVAGTRRRRNQPPQTGA
jgi:F-type H+-transporting ATPase subunit epsilon